MQVHVILFGVGAFETEGIYSLRALRREDNLPQDTIIAFEDDDDAQRCAHAPQLCAVRTPATHVVQVLVQASSPEFGARLYRPRGLLLYGRLLILC